MAIDTLEFKNNSGQTIYRITLDSVVCDAATTQQTWTYTVTELGGGQDISNWALELCPGITPISSSPDGAIVENPNVGTGEGNCLNINNPVGCFFGSPSPIVTTQIKWNVDPSFTSGTFTFTLDACYRCKKVHTSIKAGQSCFCGLICGPCCDPSGCIDCTTCGNTPPPVTRGIRFI